MRQNGHGQPLHILGRVRATVEGQARRWRTILFDETQDMLLRVGLKLGIAGSDRATSGSIVQRILMVDDLVPDPTFGAGYPRAFAIVQSLVEAGYAVDFYPMESTQDDVLRMEKAFAGAVRFHPGKGARGLRRLLWRDGGHFDALFVSRPTPMRAFLQAQWQPTGGRLAPPVIYDAEAVLSPREARRRALFGPAWSETEYQQALSAELGLARDAQAVTAVGQGDARVIKSLLDVPVFVLPHPVTIREDTPGFHARQDLLFVGRLTGMASQSPNVDSILWFVTEVMPQLDKLIGTEYRLHIAGRTEAPEIDALTLDRIVLHGIVEDLRPLYDQCRLFVAPTRYAAGIPLKVVEAMGEGIPCVVTPLLAEQLAADSPALAIGDKVSGFAEQCARLYKDAATWQVVRDGGFAHVERTCSPAAFDHMLVEVLGQVARVERNGLH